MILCFLLTCFHLRIRFAQSPTGNLRWQPPQAPLLNRTEVINATSFPAQCPQAGDAPYAGPQCVGLATNATLPVTCSNSTFFERIKGDEDCLFLNVYAPANQTGPLPVLLLIHGYG